jgi:hypothetical protein
MTRPSHYYRFYHLHNSGWRVKIMKLFIMKFSPLSFLTAYSSVGCRTPRMYVFRTDSPTGLLCYKLSLQQQAYSLIE